MGKDINQLYKCAMKSEQLLTVENIAGLIGKKIVWSSPCAEDNAEYNPYGYCGIAVIRGFDPDSAHPVNADIIEGDKLGYAFVSGDKHHLAYSDDDRYISYIKL